MIDCGHRGILILGGYDYVFGFDHGNPFNTTEWFDGFNRPILGPIMLNRHKAPSAVCVEGI